MVIVNENFTGRGWYAGLIGLTLISLKLTKGDELPRNGP